MKNSLKILMMLAFAAAVAGCKDDDKTETKPYLEGTLEIVNMPEYVQKNSLMTLDLAGITYPEDITYKWYSALMTVDTVVARKATFRTPDSVGVFSLSAVAQHSGYYSITKSATFTTVDLTPETSFRGISYSPKSIVDERDGQTYQYVTIGKLDWFAQNLAWDGAGVPFKNSPATHSFFGRLYHWDEATGGLQASGLGAGPQGVCPKGWHIPTNEDWADLAAAMSNGQITTFADKWEGLGEKTTADVYFNDERVWPYSPDNAHTNDFGWNGIPVGSTMRDNFSFSDFARYGFWWSATEKNGRQAYFRYVFFDMNSFPMSSTSKDGFGASVRCVRTVK